MHSDNKTNNCWVRAGWSFPSRGMELLIKCWRRGGMPKGSATKIYKMQQQYSGMATFVLKVFCIAFVATICYSYSYPFHFPWVRTPVPMNMSHLGATTCQELHVPSNKPNASPGFTPFSSTLRGATTRTTTTTMEKTTRSFRGAQRGAIHCFVSSFSPFLQSGTAICAWYPLHPHPRAHTYRQPPLTIPNRQTRWQRFRYPLGSYHSQLPFRIELNSNFYQFTKAT